MERGSRMACMNLYIAKSRRFGMALAFPMGIASTHVSP